MYDILSRQNAKVKEIRSLMKRKQRKEKKLFVVEGIRHIGEALDAKANFEYLLFAPDLIKSDFAKELLERMKAQDIPTFSTSPEIITSLSEKENPQGLLAVLRQNLTPLDNISPQTHPWLVALVSPQDPGNLGTVLRTIDAVGADGLIFLDGGVDVFHPSAVRASMGSLFWKTVTRSNFEVFSSWALENQYNIYGTSAKGETSYDQCEYQLPAILLLGSEREGLSADQIKICDHLLKLPMAGSTSSINLSVSSGVFLYQMHSQVKESNK